MSVYSKSKCILLIVIKFFVFKTNLIYNYRKSIWINKNESKIQLKCTLLVVTKFESLKLIYLISNYQKSIWINRNSVKSK